MALEHLHDLEQLGMVLWVELGETVEGQGVADAGDDVFALGVGQVISVCDCLSGGRVAGEAHAGAAVVSQVSEHHHLHVAGRSEVVVDSVDAPVLVSPPVGPR